MSSSAVVAASAAVPTEASIAAAAQAAKNQIQRSDDQTAAYKAALRTLPVDNDTNANTVAVEWIKIEGLPEATLSLKLQLSSPVEEAVLSSVQSKAQFNDVETSQATLSVLAIASTSAAAASTDFVAHDVDVSTVTHQVLNALAPAPVYETELVIPLVSSASSSSSTPTTATLKISYTPSSKDQREKLLSLIEKETSLKAAAREDLRKASLDLHAFQQGNSTTVSRTGAGTPAVQAGFLNKKSDKQQAQQPKPPPFWMVWYRRAAIVVPVAKNYVLFVGFIFASQYYGSHLAIPAPV